MAIQLNEFASIQTVGKEIESQKKKKNCLNENCAFVWRTFGIKSIDCQIRIPSHHWNLSIGKKTFFLKRILFFHRKFHFFK